MARPEGHPARPRWRLAMVPTVLGLIVALAVVTAAGCGDDGDSSATASQSDGEAIVAELGGPVEIGEPTRGGTLRVGIGDVGTTAGLDPTGEYALWPVLTVMLRPLLGYRGTGGPAGTELIPDAAEALPEVSSDGLTYTLRIRDGVRFGPPVDRPVTSQDYVTAFERIATPGLAQYAGYYSPIEGLEEFTESAAEDISGIATPDDRTIVITLTKPRGDFAYALALPASAPIPAEVAGCHTAAGEYGRFVVASGPYMIEGSDRQDISSCESQKPLSGYSPTRGITLVRNPSYDPATEEEGTPPAYADRIELTVNSNVGDQFDRIERGELDTSLDKPPNATVRSLLGDPEDRQRVRVNSGDTIWFLAMNLTEPPFDDVHVRKAMNLAMDFDGLRRAWGGAVQGDIATDLVPDNLLPGRLPTAQYQPLQKAPFEGDAEAARAEMRLSRYDRDADGLCDDPACRDVQVVSRNLPAWQAMTPIMRQSAAGIGVGLTIRELPIGPSYAITGAPRRKIAIAANGGAFKDYPDPATFFTIFDGRTILPEGNSNASLVGLTAATASQVGVTLPAGGVPSIDTDIDACQELEGDPRLDCWEQLDRHLTEDVVPVIPYLDATRIRIIGPAVTAYDYDQAFSDTALDRIAVEPSKQR